MEDEELERNYRDDEDRKQQTDFKVGNRRTPLSNNVLMLLGDILQPQTTGFKQINMDMSFSNLDRWALESVKNSSFLTCYFATSGFKKALYLERGKLATELVARRSLNAKSMSLFTETVTHQTQEFVDKTEKKTGFPNLFGKKKSGGEER